MWFDLVWSWYFCCCCCYFLLPLFFSVVVKSWGVYRWLLLVFFLLYAPSPWLCEIPNEIVASPLFFWCSMDNRVSLLVAAKAYNCRACCDVVPLWATVVAPLHHRAMLPLPGSFSDWFWYFCLLFFLCWPWPVRVQPLSSSKLSYPRVLNLWLLPSPSSYLRSWTVSVLSGFFWEFWISWPWFSSLDCLARVSLFLGVIPIGLLHIGVPYCEGSGLPLCFFSDSESLGAREVPRKDFIVFMQSKEVKSIIDLAFHQ